MLSHKLSQAESDGLVSVVVRMGASKSKGPGVRFPVVAERSLRVFASLLASQPAVFHRIDNMDMW